MTAAPPLRILIANDAFGDGGGVQSYIDCVAAGLVARGHAVAILHRRQKPAASAAPATCALPEFSVTRDGVDAALAAADAWAPDVCFSNNMDRLDVERGAVDRWPVVKFMHGYLGTCVSGQKRFGFPIPQPCDREFGTSCIGLYGIRHCGQLSVTKLVDQYRFARDQHDLFERYRAIVVASAHMRREFERNGADSTRVHVNPLFATHAPLPAPGSAPHDPVVMFLGRMTALKGGDVLIRAAARASASLGRKIKLIFIGDGPQRANWQALASALRVDATFAGWISGDERWDWIRGASLLAVPSTWPEPFGLVGLEAAALGVPAIAFDVGGVREWLRPGENGWLVDAHPPRAAAFAEALVRAFSRPDELESMRPRALATAHEMSLDRHLDRLEHIFRN